MYFPLKQLAAPYLTSLTRTSCLKVCVDSPHGLQIAISHSADRIELCSALALGGLTPSIGMMELAASLSAAKGIPVVAMIRPRAGDFVYDREELEVMEHDIVAAKNAGLAGVVLGASLPGGALDAKALHDLVKVAKSPAVCIPLSHPSFHHFSLLTYNYHSERIRYSSALLQ